ncbi:MAG TPA: hypothetical protein ENN39_03125 [Desulfonatronum sp.]|nr:hypothetical protein [Desulfonatronum sp.]
MHPVRLFMPFFFLVILLLTACASISRPGLERNHYLLQVQRPKTINDPPSLDFVLAVRTLRIAPGYDSKPFITLRDKGRVEANFHEHFFLPPGEMLTNQVRQWLTDAALFAHVTDLASFKGPDLILEGFVPVFYRDLSGESAKAVLAVQFLVLRPVRDGTSAIVLHKDFFQEVALHNASARELVRGWNEALRLILIDLETELRRALQGFACESIQRGGEF